MKGMTKYAVAMLIMVILGVITALAVLGLVGTPAGPS